MTGTEVLETCFAALVIGSISGILLRAVVEFISSIFTFH